MKPLFVSISLLILFIGCKRDWDHPLSTDEDLINIPNIVQIDLDSDNNANIILDYAYSDSSIIVLERRSIGGFETVNFIRKTQVTLLDTTFDKETDHNFIYRIYVTKGKYRSPYSEEKQLTYTSAGLNKPQDLSTSSEELKGIHLFWKDKSNNEVSYKIEKDEGSGFNEIATLSSNSVSYFDAISGIPDPPLQLTYRIKAVNSTKESDWTSIALTYAGLGSPTNLRITNTSPANFRIEWQDNSNIETGYSIERKKDNDNFIEIAQVGTDTLSFYDNISELGIYTYRVRTIKDGVFSTYSNEVFQEVISLIPTEGLVAYYPFNGNANDESGNGNDGVLLGGATAVNVLKIGHNDYDRMKLPHNSINGLTDFTFSSRLKINTLHASGANTWVSCARTSEANALLLIYHAGEAFWRIFLNGTYKNINEKSILHDNDWHHVVILRKGSIARLFTDGVEIGAGISVSASELNLSEGGSIIGQDQDKLGGDFDEDQSWAGEIDNFRIYNRALIEDEILILYHEEGWGN